MLQKRLKKERDLEAQGVSKSRLLLYSVVVQKTAKSKTSLAYLSAEVNQFLRLIGDVLQLIGDLSFQIKNGSLQGKHIRRGLALVHGARRPAAGVHHHEGH